MAALLTHFVIGVFVGLALRVRLRYVPLVGIAASFMDLDNLFFYLDRPDPWWITRRGTLQNLWVCIMMPALGATGILLWNPRRTELVRLAASMPVATASHTFYDMIFPNPPYVATVGHMLLYPFSQARWSFDIAIFMSDERLFDGYTLLLLALVTLVATGFILTKGAERDESSRVQLVRGIFFLAIYLIVIPSLLFGLGGRTA